MNQRKFLAIAVILIVVAVGGAGYYFAQIRPPEVTRRTVTPTTSGQPTIPQPPKGPVSIYKGIWMMTHFNFPQSSPLDVDTLRDLGVNIVQLAPIFKINAKGDVQYPSFQGDTTPERTRMRFHQLARSLYEAGIRICFYPSLWYQEEFTENATISMAHGPTRVPASIAEKEGFLDKFSLVVEDMAKLAERYKVEMFAPLAEPENQLNSVRVAVEWSRKILPIVRKHYSGTILIKWGFTEYYFQKERLINPDDFDFRGYDVLGITIGAQVIGTADGRPITPEQIAEYKKFLDTVIEKAISLAKRDNVPEVMITEMGVWGNEIVMSDEDKLLVHRMIFEAGKGKMKGFFVDDPIVGFGKTFTQLKGTKFYEEIKLWFKEKLES